jgi:K+-sensing histidine kinase KdpD
MKVRNASRWAPRGLRGWYFAVLALVVASGVRMLLHPLLGPIMPGTAFFIAAALIEYFFGMAPALAVMSFGLVIADYLFVPPYQQIAILDQSDVGLMISLPLITILVICLIEKLRRSQLRAELIGLVAQSRYEMLLRADNERVIASRAADETHRLLRHLPHYHDDIILIKALDRRAMQEHSDAARNGISKPMPAATATAPGSRYEHVHSNDIVRLSSTLQPGSHRARIDVGRGKYKLMDCICERFTTHAGDFLVLRLGD